MKTVESGIRAFMTAAKQEQPDRPTMPNEKLRLLRASLIMEEALEQCAAWGVRVMVEANQVEPDGLVQIKGNTKENMNHSFAIIGADGKELPVDLVEIVDGAYDQVYVSIGGNIAIGFHNNDAGFQIVQDANMGKFGPGAWTDDRGKVQKPKDWAEKFLPNPKIEAMIKEQQAA